MTERATAFFLAHHPFDLPPETQGLEIEYVLCCQMHPVHDDVCKCVQHLWFGMRGVCSETVNNALSHARAYGCVTTRKLKDKRGKDIVIQLVAQTEEFWTSYVIPFIVHSGAVTVKDFLCSRQTMLDNLSKNKKTAAMLLAIRRHRRTSLNSHPYEIVEMIARWVMHYRYDPVKY